MVYDAIIDFETLGKTPNATLIEMSVVPFVANFEEPPTFEELVFSGKTFKFELKHQAKLGRVSDKDTIEWWKKQSDEAKQCLKPSKNDLTIPEAVPMIMNWFNERVDFKKSLIWTRGDIDVTWLTDMYRNVLGSEVTNDLPVMFVNFREIRTAISENLNSRHDTYCPLPNGTLSNFVKHNSVHDCARDVLMYLYSKRYAFGLEDIPTDVDPNSIR